jgi:hypothetical protein
MWQCRIVIHWSVCRSGDHVLGIVVSNHARGTPIPYSAGPVAGEEWPCAEWPATRVPAIAQFRHLRPSARPRPGCWPGPGAGADRRTAGDCAISLAAVLHHFRARAGRGRFHPACPPWGDVPQHPWLVASSQSQSPTKGRASMTTRELYARPAAGRAYSEDSATGTSSPQNGCSTARACSSAMR